jgi:hypothetical protein
MQLGSYNTCNSSTFIASQTSINKIQPVTLPFYCMQYHPVLPTICEGSAIKDDREEADEASEEVGTLEG